MLLYYITERQQFPGSEAEKRAKLLAKIAEAASAGVDFIQLRERDLTARELEALAGKALLEVRQATSTPGVPKLLINSRVDVALAVGADGVHLRSDDIAASEARSIAAKSSVYKGDATQNGFYISVSCHSPAEIRLAESHGADLVLFAPVFEKAGGDIQPHGVKGLRVVCGDRRAARPPVAILALGGVDVSNAASCLKAGAAGVAGIRLFQEGDVGETVRRLRSIQER